MRPMAARFAVLIALLMAVGPSPAQGEAAPGSAPAPAANPAFEVAAAPNQKDGLFIARLRAGRAAQADAAAVVQIASRKDGWYRDCGRVAPGQDTFESVEASYPYRLKPPEGACFVLIDRRKAIVPYWLEGEQWLSASVEKGQNLLSDVQTSLRRLDDLVGERAEFDRRAAPTEARVGARLEALAASLGGLPDSIRTELKAEPGTDYETLLSLCRGAAKRAPAGEAAVWRGRADQLRPLAEEERRLAEIRKRRADLKAGVVATAQGILSQLGEFEARLLSFEAEARAVFMVHSELTAAELDGPHPFAGVRGTWERTRAELLARGAKSLAPDELDRLDRARYLLQLSDSYGALVALRHEMPGCEREAIDRVSAAVRRAGLDAEAFGAEAPAEAPAPGAAETVAALTALHRERHEIKRNMDAEDVSARLAPVEKRLADMLGEVRKRAASALAADFRARLGGGGTAPAGGAHMLGRMLSRLRFMARPIRDRLEARELDFDRRRYYFRLGYAAAEGGEPAAFVGEASAVGGANLFNTGLTVNLICGALFIATLLAMIVRARMGTSLFIRRIPGLEAIDEAIGRATEMGRPVLFAHGLTGVGDITVMASLNILGRIAQQVAVYDSRVVVANNDPIVYAISQEVVREGCVAAGRPDVYNPDDIFMCATEQFPYVAAVAGIMAREAPAANLFMGYFYAESLILAEAGAATGAIQIAGTDSFTQLPFFVTTCDYTLMGEELYAASAYLSREPKLLGTLKAQDWGKAAIAALIVAGTVWHFAAPAWNLIALLLKVYE